MRVRCKHCQHENDVDEYWCVIDTKNKERYFECKKFCEKKWTSQEFFPKKEEEIRSVIEIDTAVDDWMDRIPRQTWVEWFKSFFGLSGIRYIKVKTN